MTVDSTSRPVLVWAPGKVILFGEHAVVYGKKAVAASLGLHTYAVCRTRADSLVEFNLPDLNVSLSWDVSALPNSQFSRSTPDHLDQLEQHCWSLHDRNVKRAVLAFLYLFCGVRSETIGGSKSTGIDLTLVSDLPLAGGLGSSASFAVALAAGMLGAFGALGKPKEADRKDEIDFDQDHLRLVNEWAFVAEKVMHGNPSGLDNTLCTYGGALAYSKGHFNKIDKFTSFRFLLTSTKVPKDTKVQVEKVRVRREMFPEVIDPILDSIHHISLRCIDLFNSAADQDDHSVVEASLKECISINHALLNALGVSHPSLERVCEITARYRLHSKLTGAGGGGCALTLIPQGFPGQELHNVVADLEKEGYQCFETSIAGPGIRGMELGPEVLAGNQEVLNPRELKSLFDH
ncbi:mevalonate kinase-like protein [Cladochytrium replicatum]|nr:mevalonate kinase-like protein [Cladochytrium replicatum]